MAVKTYYEYEVRNGFRFNGRARTIHEALGNVASWCRDIDKGGRGIEEITIRKVAEGGEE